MPLDPNDLEDTEATEFCWGPGMFPPGIANGEGQARQQDDFSENLHPRPNPIGDRGDNYARMVADRRTDPTDPESGRDFETYGNPDRYGANPELVQADPVANRRTIFPEYGMPPLKRRR